MCERNNNNYSAFKTFNLYYLKVKSENVSVLTEILCLRNYSECIN